MSRIDKIQSHVLMSQIYSATSYNDGTIIVQLIPNLFYFIEAAVDVELEVEFELRR